MADVSFDIFSADALANRCSHYEAMRRSASVYHDERLDLWYLTRYADVVQASRDPSRFSSELGLAGGWTVRHPGPPPRQMNFQAGLNNSRVLIALDRPDHGELRRVLRDFFSSRSIQRSNAGFRARIDALVADPSFEGDQDLVSGFAELIPPASVTAILGVSNETADQLATWTTEMNHSWDPSHPNSLAEKSDGMGRLGLQMLRAIARDVKAGSTADEPSVIDVLLETRPLGMSEIEVVSNVALLALIGVHTTVLGLGTVLLHLASEPDRQQALRANPDDIEPFAHELLRIESPVQMSWRGMRDDVQIGDVTLSAGARVALVYGSANRDERYFDDPLAIRPGRSGSTLFGTGMHSCIGAALAMSQITNAVTALLAGTRHFELAGTSRPTTNALTHGYQSVPVSITK